MMFAKAETANPNKHPTAIIPPNDRNKVFSLEGSACLAHSIAMTSAKTHEAAAPASAAPSLAGFGDVVMTRPVAELRSTFGCGYRQAFDPLRTLG